MTRRDVATVVVLVAATAGVGAGVWYLVGDRADAGYTPQAEAVVHRQVLRRRARVLPRPCAHAASAVLDPYLASVIATWTAKHPATAVTVWRTSSAMTACPVPVAAQNQYWGLLPASNQKLITTAGALLTLGPNYRYTTTLVAPADAVVNHGGLTGTVTLVGTGDPIFATSAYAHRYLGATGDTIDLLAGRLRRGDAAHPAVTHITGAMRVNGGVFDADEFPPDWTAADIGSIQPLSGAATNEDFAGDVQRSVVANPVLATAQRLRTALHAAHVTTASGAPIGYGPVPRLHRVLAAVTSPPLRTIVRAMNVPSDDFIAEQLVKTIGAHVALPGTSAGGLRRVRADMAGLLGVTRAGDSVADGSGLARADRETSLSLAWLMLDAQRAPSWGGPLLASLPAPGQGTLRHRLHGLAGRVRAKTGTLDDVSSLTGIVHARNGKTYTFVILCNSLKLKDIAPAHVFQDAIVARLAGGVAG
jgi:D-alanyl-D-alanine carboxypeptidase/D-alanyl-D-alanine-endopeptidase (penicillin-binding protein 4)